MRKIHSSLLATVVLTTLFSSSLKAETHALVIGINQYINGDNLEGAVSDAQDITQALKQSGVRNIRTLINHNASKSAIFSSWKNMIRNSRLGDTLVVTYAGHGGQIPDLNNDERDGQDEAFLLTNFQETRQTAKDNMIIDDEWHHWFSLADNRQVIFVVDACNSGTISRGMSTLFKTRFQKVNHIPQAVPEAKQKIIPHRKKDHVITFAATTENTKIQETIINGKKRGVLSWAFANAIRGKADRDRNSILSKQELESYITHQVQTQIKHQRPQYKPRGFGSKPLLKAAKVLSPKTKQLTTTLSSLGGDKVNYSVSGNRYSYLTLYNITNNGTIQFLYPSQREDGNGRIQNKFNLELEVDHQFTGQETVVTIISEKPQTKLHQRLLQLDGVRSFNQLQREQKTLINGRHEIKKTNQQLAG